MTNTTISAKDEQTIISNATFTVAKLQNYYTSRLGCEHFFSKQDIEDIISDAICKACCSFSSFDSEKGKLSTWVTKIASNCVIDAVNYKIKRSTITYSLSIKNRVNGDEFDFNDVYGLQSGFDSDITEINRDWETDAVYDRVELADALETAISSLSEREQRVERMYLAGYAPREIAVLESCTPNAISVILNRIHKAMKGSLVDLAKDLGIVNCGKGRKGIDE